MGCASFDIVIYPLFIDDCSATPRGGNTVSFYVQ